MAKTLAVMNCKSLKRDSPAATRDMYDRSAQFRAQRDLFEEAYDGWVVLSAKHGVVLPNEIIEPYDLSMYNKAQQSRLKSGQGLTKEEKEQWSIAIRDHSIWDEYDEVHFHVSKAYWDPIKNYFPNGLWVKQQVNPGLVVIRYQEALDKYRREGVLDLGIISIHRKSKNPEMPRTWYHPLEGEYYGYARDVSKDFEVDEGNLHRVSMGKAKQTRGWVVEENYLKRLVYDASRDQWRLGRG